MGLVVLAASIVLPNITANDDGATSRTAESLAQMIRFARDESLRTQRPHLFTLSNTTAEVRETSYNPPTEPVPVTGALLYNPVTRQPYRLDMTSAYGTAGLALRARFITSDGQNRTQVYFDANGVPKHLDATGHYPLTAGEVVISGGLRGYSVTLGPITGRVNVEAQ